jgi:hypothetical protein
MRQAPSARFAGTSPVNGGGFRTALRQSSPVYGGGVAAGDGGGQSE